MSRRVRFLHCYFDSNELIFFFYELRDVICGLLHCSHLNERLEFGIESVAVLSHSFLNVDGKIVPCRTANIDLGLESVDAGLVPNGARCAPNKVLITFTEFNSLKN